MRCRPSDDVDDDDDGGRAATRDDCAMMEDDARTYETDDSDGSDTVTALIERTTETEKITRDYCATEDSARERTGDANASDAMIEALEGKIKSVRRRERVWEGGAGAVCEESGGGDGDGEPLRRVDFV